MILHKTPRLLFFLKNNGKVRGPFNIELVEDQSTMADGRGVVLKTNWKIKPFGSTNDTDRRVIIV